MAPWHNFPTLPIMRDVEYRSSGVPLENYPLTRHDHRRQKESEESSRWVRQQVDEDNAKCRADPAMAERRRQAFAEVAKLMESFKKQDHEIMRWRVRLYCGHIIETAAHYTYTNPIDAGAYSKRCLSAGKSGRRLWHTNPLDCSQSHPSPHRHRHHRLRRSQPEPSLSDGSRNWRRRTNTFARGPAAGRRRSESDWSSTKRIG